MIVKQSPEDFIVEELTTLSPCPEGVYALYLLEKRGWTTPAVLAAVRERWHITPKALAVGGLKDRHAHTRQFFTIRQGPQANIVHDDFSVIYQHQVALPYESTDIRANRFTLTIRDLPTATVPDVPGRIPNYFDDQRFGSVGDGAFIAKEMVQGNFEQALRLALVAPYEFDRRIAKQTKHALRMNWGNWSACAAHVRDRNVRHVLRHLQRSPSDFRGACLRLPADLLVLYLHAWQSHLWNRLLDGWLRQHSYSVPTTLTLKTGSLALPNVLNPVGEALWDKLILPLPTARLTPDPTASWTPILDAIMASEGLTLKDMRIPGLRQPFFSKGVRPAAIVVDQWHATSTPDDRHAGRYQLRLQFELPRGSYATMVLKCLNLPLQPEQCLPTVSLEPRSPHASS